VSDRQQITVTPSRRRYNRVLGVGVGGAVLAWGAAAVSGASTARADVLDAVIDPIISAASAAISSAIDSSAGLAADSSSAALDLGSLAGNLLDFTHLAALPAEATSAAAVEPLAASSASSASPLDGLLDQFLQQAAQEWMGGATSAPDAVAADPVNATIPLNTVNTTIPQIGINGIEGQVTISVNGGAETSAEVDTGSAGLLVPIQDVGLQNLGLPTGFETLTYGDAELSQTIQAAEFTAPISFGDGIVTNPTEIAVPLWTTVHETLTLENPIDLSQLGLGSIDSIPITLSFPDIPPFTEMYNVEPILGIGAAGTLPSNPVTEALPGDLSQGVLLNLADHSLTFGPNPLDATTTLDGSPLTTVQVQIGDGPLTTVTAAFDSGGQYGTLPSSLLTSSEITPIGVSAGTLSASFENEVTPGTVISVYTPSGELLYQTTASASDPTIVDNSDLFNTGLTPFLNHDIFIGYGPNDGSPGMTNFTPNVGFTVFDN